MAMPNAHTGAIMMVTFGAKNEPFKKKGNIR
jgi:hypothetical protein